jgi:hypothetical protein
MFIEAGSQTDACASLLAEVDFKWLMAGQGLRIDLPRFRSDAVYAAKLLSLALDSESFALRERASLLQAQSIKQLTPQWSSSPTTITGLPIGSFE